MNFGLEAVILNEVKNLRVGWREILRSLRSLRMTGGVACSTAKGFLRACG